MLTFLKTRGFKSFFFTDDDFAASRRQLEHLLRSMVEHELAIEFDANVRPDSLVRCAQLAPLLRKAGCRCLWLGIESGSASIQRSYGKGFDAETCEKAVAVAFAATDVVRTNWIIGAPMESEDTVQASIDLAARLLKLGPHVPHVSYLVPYPGTPICNDALAMGLITPWKLELLANTTHEAPVMPSRYLSTTRLRELFKKFHRTYYNGEFFSSVPTSVAAEARLVLQSADLVECD